MLEKDIKPTGAVEVNDEPSVIEDTKDVGLEFSNWEIKALFNTALSSIKLNDIDKDEKINLIKLKIELSKITEQIHEFEKTTIESLKTKEYTDLEQTVNSVDASKEDKELFSKMQNDLDKEANAVLLEMYNTIVTVNVNKISEDTFYKIADTLDSVAPVTLSGVNYIYNKLVKK